MQIPTLYGDPGPNRQNIYLHVKNVDTTTILRGTPCVYAMNNNVDTNSVVNAVTAGANKSTAYFAGIAVQDIRPQETGMALISGVAEFVRCSAAVTADSALTVNPAGNNFVPGAAVSAIIAIATVGPVQMPPLVSGVASLTVEGVANVSTRVIVRAI